MENLKYEYMLSTWGGFYNEEYQALHKYEEGYHYFDSEEEREKYIQKLRCTEEDLDAKHLMISKSEGYNVRVNTVLHRVIKYQDKEYYSKYDIGCAYPYEHAKYHLEYKWYPGFNDYPLGEDFDYENNQVETIQEWITGAFDITKEF